MFAISAYKTTLLFKLRNWCHTPLQILGENKSFHNIALVRFKMRF